MKKELINELLQFEAPYLIEKLVKENIVETKSEAEALFLELKHWLILIHTDKSKNWEMYSLKVDEVWHQFILYTQEYAKFCSKYFNTYLHHSPSNSPQIETVKTESGSFEEFRESYESYFHQPLSELWYDENGITWNRRIVNYFSKKMGLLEEENTLQLLDQEKENILTIDKIAKDALQFIIGTSAFYVREIPGLLTDAEKVSLVKILVEFNILRSA